MGWPLTEIAKTEKCTLGGYLTSRMTGWMDRGPTKCYHMLTHILHESPRLKDTLEVESHDVSPDPRKETGNVGKEMGRGAEERKPANLQEQRPLTD